MTKNTKSTSTKTVAKAATQKKAAKKVSPVSEAYGVLTSELKRLSAEKKSRKSELLKKLDALWTEYKKYRKEEYIPARKAAIDKFVAIKTEVAKNRAAKKDAKPKTTKIQKSAAKKVTAEIATTPEVTVEAK